TGADGIRYDQVLTIYLKQPVPICGNHICEGPVPEKLALYPTDTVFETPTSCPSDCHPDTWAKGVDLFQPRLGPNPKLPCAPGECFTSFQNGTAFDFGRRITVAPDGTLIRLLDMLPRSGPGINFGAETETPFAAPGGDSILARYTPAGSALMPRLLELN